MIKYFSYMYLKMKVGKLYFDPYEHWTRLQRTVFQGPVEQLMLLEVESAV